jgi:hypothetical protein
MNQRLVAAEGKFHFEEREVRGMGRSASARIPRDA